MKSPVAGPSETEDTARRRFARGVLAGAILVSLLVTALVALSLFNSRRHYHRLAEDWTRNTARILENDLVCTFDKIGTVLQSSAHEARRQLATGGLRQAELDDFLQEQARGTPELFALRITDAEGQMRYGTGIPPGEWVRVADRDYFSRLRDDPRAVTSVSELFRGRFTGHWNISLARRIDGPDGRFAGAVVGSFEVGSFDRMFSQLEIGRFGAIGVRDQQCRLVALYPKGDEPGSQIGSDLVSAKTRALIQAHTAAATYSTTFARDHLERLVTFRQVTGYPFYIFATRSPSDFLASWRREAAFALALLGIFLAATALLTRTFLKGRATEHARFEAVRAGAEWQRQNEELNEALSRVKRLEGIIPICAYCKKIRTEEQSWERLEQYFTEHMDATFSHGACPDCVAEQKRIYQNR